MLTYPVELPAPNREDFGFSPVDVVQRTTSAEGDIRARNLAVIAPYIYAVSWDLKGGEINVFQNFHDVALRNGTEAFLCPIFLGNSFQTRTTRFIAKPDYRQMGHDFVRVTSQIYVTGRVAPVLWYNFTPADANTTITLDTLSGFTPTRADVYTRVAFNGTSPVVYAGWTNILSGGSIAELVEAAPVATAGQAHIITDGATYAGSALGDLQASSTAVKVRLHVTGTPTLGDAAIAITYTQ